MGFIHIYCGDGKGKTTAAVGLAVRAAGRDQKVVIARFLKSDDSGEVISLKSMKGVTVLPCEETFGFYWNMTEDDKKKAECYYKSLLEKAFSTAKSQNGDLLVLDEVMGVCHHGLVDEERLKVLLAEREDGLEVVMTGRNPSQRLVDLADYVSEIKALKHPFEKGVGARRGIEY